MRATPTRYCLLLLLSLLAFPAIGADAPRPQTRKTEESEMYEDGSLHFRVPLNSAGQRHGQYIAYYRGGKRIQQRVNYEKGLRTGSRVIFDADGRIISDELWVQGKLVFPKSTRLIETERARLLKEAAAYVKTMPKPGNPRAPSPGILAGALAKLNFFRALADVPSDITLDDRYTNQCQYAAELLEIIGHLTHTPEKPTGYDNTAYELGLAGCSHSNIFQSSAMTNCVEAFDGYMGDSNATNIDRLGHRRWILDPAMRKTGFGDSRHFSAMYALDHSRPEIEDFDFICFPPRGLCPLNMFGPTWAWHISVNPAKFRASDDAALEIFEVDAKLKRLGPALPLNFSHVDLSERGGTDNAVIARPDATAVRAGAMYEVVVHGIANKDGKPVEMSYYVSFYNSTK